MPTSPEVRPEAHEAIKSVYPEMSDEQIDTILDGPDEDIWHVQIAIQFKILAKIEQQVIEAEQLSEKHHQLMMSMLIGVTLLGVRDQMQLLGSAEWATDSVREHLQSVFLKLVLRAEKLGE